MERIDIRKLYQETQENIEARRQAQYKDIIILIKNASSSRDYINHSNADIRRYDVDEVLIDDGFDIQQLTFNCVISWAHPPEITRGEIKKFLLEEFPSINWKPEWSSLKTHKNNDLTKREMNFLQIDKELYNVEGCDRLLENEKCGKAFTRILNKIKKSFSL